MGRAKRDISASTSGGFDTVFGTRRGCDESQLLLEGNLSKRGLELYDELLEEVKSGSHQRTLKLLSANMDNLKGESLLKDLHDNFVTILLSSMHDRREEENMQIISRQLGLRDPSRTLTIINIDDANNRTDAHIWPEGPKYGLPRDAPKSSQTICGLSVKEAKSASTIIRGAWSRRTRCSACTEQAYRYEETKEAEGVKAALGKEMKDMLSVATAQSSAQNMGDFFAGKITLEQLQDNLQTQYVDARHQMLAELCYRDRRRLIRSALKSNYDTTSTLNPLELLSKKDWEVLIRPITLPDKKTRSTPYRQQMDLGGLIDQQSRIAFRRKRAAAKAKATS